MVSRTAADEGWLQRDERPFEHRVEFGQHRADPVAVTDRDDHQRDLGVAAEERRAPARAVHGPVDAMVYMHPLAVPLKMHVAGVLDNSVPDECPQQIRVRVVLLALGGGFGIVILCLGHPWSPLDYQ